MLLYCTDDYRVRSIDRIYAVIFGHLLYIVRPKSRCGTKGLAHAVIVDKF